MRQFLETTFGPAELQIVETVLDEWRQKRNLSKDNQDVSLAAAVLINLFREGHDTVPALRQAASEHKALSELA